MKAVVYEDFGQAEQIVFKDMPKPNPTAHEVQIEIYYAGVNPVDWKIGAGLLHNLMPHEFPVILGWDAAGMVSEVGEKVKNFKVGDPVYAYCRKEVVHDGTYTEFICVDEDHVAPKPENLNFREAAAIPLTALTAWQALFDALDLMSGQTILIHAGAGGVGGMAIQFAHYTDAEVITTAQEKHHDYVKDLGANHIIDYTQEDFAEQVKKIAPNGVDAVLDTVGGETLQKSYGLVKIGGHLVSIVEKPDHNLAAQHQIKEDFVFVQPNGHQLRKIAKLFENEKIHVPNIEEMNLDEALDAIRKSRTHHTRGKIVLKTKV